MLECENIEAPDTSTDIRGRGERGVGGIGGDTGVAVDVGETSSAGTGALRELLFGRGGVF